jgi:hypothetical protein
MPYFTYAPVNQYALTETLTILRRSRPNVLIVGDSGSVERALEGVRPHLAAPIAYWSPCACQAWPDEPFRTLIVNGVDAMSLEQQQGLMSLNDDVDGDVQVISTADAPPFDAVERNAFLSRLYYQLNVVLLDVRHASK